MIFFLILLSFKLFPYKAIYNINYIDDVKSIETINSL